MLQAVSPASLELSLAAGLDIEHERKLLDDHWQQRLTRDHAMKVNRRDDSTMPSIPITAWWRANWNAAGTNQCVRMNVFRSNTQSLRKDCPKQLSSEERELILAPVVRPARAVACANDISRRSSVGGSIAPRRSYRECGREYNEVVHFAAFKRGEDLFKREEIEAAADVIIWSTDSGDEVETTRSRPYDRHFRGNVVQAMDAYATGEFGDTRIPLRECKRTICIGSDRMMNAVRESRFGVLEPHLMPKYIAIGSINSPMQCMMKEICAQCLCKQADPVIRRRSQPGLLVLRPGLRTSTASTS